MTVYESTRRSLADTLGADASADAVAAVCPGGREQLASLVDKSLLVAQRPTDGGPTRLPDAGDAAGVRRRTARRGRHPDGRFDLERVNDDDAARWVRVALEVPGADRANAAPLLVALGTIAEVGRHHAGEVLSGPAARFADVTLEADDPARQLLALVPLVLKVFGVEISVTTSLDEPDPWVRAVNRFLELTFAEHAGDTDRVRDGINGAGSSRRCDAFRGHRAGEL